jgi:hypothetical protein
MAVAGASAPRIFTCPRLATNAATATQSLQTSRPKHIQEGVLTAWWWQSSRGLAVPTRPAGGTTEAMPVDACNACIALVCRAGVPVACRPFWIVRLYAQSRNCRPAQCGKSTLFNALTRSRKRSANYPFCTIDPMWAS